MASQWHSLISQKLFLARTLLLQTSAASAVGDEPETTQRLRGEAALQGSLELVLRARKLLLAMIAQLYQKKGAKPESLDELAALAGEEANEVRLLRQLEQLADSWWNHLDQLEQAQGRPPQTRKTVSSENIIAVSATTGPDRSVATLTKTLDDLKNFADDLEELHSEW